MHVVPSLLHMMQCLVVAAGTDYITGAWSNMALMQLVEWQAYLKLGKRVDDDGRHRCDLLRPASHGMRNCRTVTDVSSDAFERNGTVKATQAALSDLPVPIHTDGDINNQVELPQPERCRTARLLYSAYRKSTPNGPDQ